MFGFIGLGGQEILCLLFLGVVAAGLVLLLARSRDRGRAALEDENRRLREENDRLRGRPD
jgi:hypothetical protein